MFIQGTDGAAGVVGGDGGEEDVGEGPRMPRARAMGTVPAMAKANSGYGACADGAAGVVAGVGVPVERMRVGQYSDIHLGDGPPS